MPSPEQQPALDRFNFINQRGEEGEFTVNPLWCKGCGICVAFCPVGVLELDRIVSIARAEECIKCGICEQMCPDFAITID